MFAYQWGDGGIDVARQRHLLQAQASDVLLGKLFERLRDAGTYDTSVAITVDGVVAAVTTTSPTPYGVSIAHALLWPGAVHEGDNDIGMYVLDGPVDAPKPACLGGHREA